MTLQDAFDCGLLVGILLAGAGYLTWPSLERWARTWRQDPCQKIMAKDQVLASLDAMIARRRRAHGSVRSLLAQRQARVHELLAGARK